MSLEKISQERFNKVCDLYFSWKSLNSGIKENYSRGVNLPEAITEPVCCYVNGFLLSLGEGSEDAVDPNNNNQIQVKATSNWDRDLTSFGPRSHFSELHFVRLNQSEDKMYLYNIPIDDLKDVKVNVNETFEEQQADNRRPRFCIIDKYIKPFDIRPYAIVDLKQKVVEVIELITN
ncbi:Bsp6I family type II restriction endonuclease [Clostridium sp.]|uniref:Bsp6I family type II restriction endonuclease n=1 Tax=Clostridium sp. TaxID=1506 RepID=UPI0025C5A901|nr:Bsp6I family type II restriction endonuclease [Clostridium sp.]